MNSDEVMPERQCLHEWRIFKDMNISLANRAGTKQYMTFFCTRCLAYCKKQLPEKIEDYPEVSE